VINPFIFREYDIRGLVATDLTTEAIVKIGKAFGSLVKRDGGNTVTIGGDVRESTTRIREDLISGITSTGINIIIIGDCPTGAQYFSHFEYKVPYGIMITGSHNPPEFNGLKLTMNYSNIYGERIQDILKLIKSEDFENGSGKVETKLIKSIYSNFIRSKIRMKKPLKVVLDCGNGAAALSVNDCFDNIENLEVIHLFNEPDGSFPNHHPDPTVEKNLIDLKKAIKENNADFGIGFDGDADRIGVVAADGEVVWGDKLLSIYAKDALSRKKQKIIFDVKCSDALIEAIEKSGGEAVMSATGHSLLKAKLKETGAEIGGEMSGHMFFGDECFGYDDAIYAAARLIRIISNSEKTLSDYLSELTPYYSTPETRLETESDEEKFRITKEAVAYFTKNYNCITIDGVRIKFDDGWGLIRSSNTQPVIVVRMEAKTEEKLKEYKDLIINKLKEYGKINEDADH
jgi:phosphomannomutase / phosphoglucomutase